MLDIVYYSDSFLRKKAQAVQSFDEKLHTLLDEMYVLMIERNGVGLAAPQVRHSLRALVINLPDEEGEQHKENLLEVLNPQIIEHSGKILFNEGCLSVPEYYDDIERSEKVTVAYQDRFGNQHTLDAEGYLAVALQHEIDHLDGILFVDRLPLLKRKRFEKAFKKQQCCSA
ncbi:MAG: peptide deformylase [Helicobacter sp.]|nr:peptide deformylase [Helicobacter sp.]